MTDDHPMVQPAAPRGHRTTGRRVSPSGPARTAAFCVAGFLAAFLALNTYWAFGGTWGVAWVLGCAGCTVPLALVWVQEAMVVAGIGVVLARVGLWRPPLPGRLWSVGLWTMAGAFGAVGAQNLLGDTTPQARYLFAPLALALSALSAGAARGLGRAERRSATVGAGGRTEPGHRRSLSAFSGPPPRWARRAATVAALTTVPSGLWRTSMVVGVPVGASDEVLAAHYGFPGWGTVYVFGLTTLLVSLSLLTLGLVQGWGEVFPRWMPLVGGRDVPPRVAVIPAGTGAVLLTLLWASVFSNVGQIWDLYGLEGAARALMVACYSPLILWGPLLGAVTVSYARRRAHPGRAERLGRRSASVGGARSC